MTSSPAPHDAAATGTLSFHLDLPLTDRAAALARRTLEDVLRNWDITDRDWTYDVVLVSSELVGNAVRHGGRRVALGLTLDAMRLTVSVTDGSTVIPAQRDDADESGRGLAIIDALAETWGVTEHADGKTVWAALRRPATTPGTPFGAPDDASSAHGLAS